MALMTESATETIDYPGAGVALRGFLARPPETTPRAAIVILHEWWGLTDHMKDVARRFTAEGYVALAPDLYSRLGHSVATDPQQAAKLMESLQSQQVLKDLNATTRYLKAQPFVDAWKLGVVGFSMGGTFALMMASHNSDIKAAVAFYGQIPPSDSLKYLVAPVLYLHGGQDTWIVKREAERLAQALVQHGRPGEVKIYPDCPHAFFNDTRPEVYRSDQAHDAWQRTLNFFQQHLR